MLGRHFVGPNSLWAQFVTVIVQLMYYLVLWLCCHMFFFSPHQDLHAKIVNKECSKLSSRQGVAALKNLTYKIYFDLFNTFLATTWFHMCYFIVLMSSLLNYDVENSKNKEKPWNG